MIIATDMENANKKLRMKGGTGIIKNNIAATIYMPRTASVLFMIASFRGG
jgi:hypothetical protein